MASKIHKNGAEINKDVMKLIAQYPSLAIREQEPRNVTDDGTTSSEKKTQILQKVHCSLTGHEMPCRVPELEKYVSGKKFRKAQERNHEQFDKYKPHIVPSKKKGRTHQLFCTLTLRHINCTPAHVERHVIGRRYKKALLKYEECQRLGIQFKPLTRNKTWEDKSEGSDAKKYSRNAASDSSESEAESDDSMSDLYPREHFSRLSPDAEEGEEEEKEEAEVDDDDDSDYDIENMEVGSQEVNGASTSSNPKRGVKRKSHFQRGPAKSKSKTVPKQHSLHRRPGKKPYPKKRALKQPRKEAT